MCEVCADTELNLKRLQVLAVSPSEDQKDTTVNSGFHNGLCITSLESCLLSLKSFKGSDHVLIRGIHWEGLSKLMKVLSQSIQEVRLKLNSSHMQDSTNAGPVHL